MCVYTYMCILHVCLYKHATHVCSHGEIQLNDNILQGLCMGFQSQLKKDQYQLIIQLMKTALPLLSSTAVQATIPRPKGNHVQVSPQDSRYHIGIKF